MNSYKSGVTKAGSIVNIVRKYSDKLYILECSSCSKDVEMWGGVEYILGRPLGDGAFSSSCCCGLPVFSERQRLLQVVRLCSDLGYEFEGWFGKFVGRETKLNLYNPVSGNRWSGCSIGNLIKGRKDPSMRGTKRYDDKVFIERFKNIIGGDVQYEREEVNTWNFTCNTCKEDEFSVSGKLPYTFKTNTAHLSAGFVPCRCSKSHVNTQPEWKFLIGEICKDRNIRMLTKETEIFNSRTRMEWVCEKGHLRENSLESFKNNLGGCKECNQICNGYMVNRVHEQDNLYIFCIGDDYLKIGRSFNIKRREQELRRSSGISDINLLSYFSGKHQDVYNTEQHIHSVLRSKHLSYPTTWTTESFKKDSLGLVLKILSESVLI